MKIHCLFDKMVSTSELKEHPDNSNSHSKEQIERLAKILEYQGWRYPIKVSKLSGFITSGHGRLAAARLLKLSQVPVNYQGYESKEQEMADLVSDNSIAAWAELDLVKINDIFKDMPNFDIDLLGIKDFSIVEPVVAQCDEDHVPEQVPAVSVLGDLYELGEHRLLCGDSTSIDAVEKLMKGEKADMVFTDPPYGMNLDTEYDKMFGNDSSHVKTGNRFQKVKGDNIDYDPNPIFAIKAKEYYIWGADYFYDKLPKGGSWIAWDKRDENLDNVPGNTTEFLWSKNPHRRMSLRIKWSGHHGMQNEDVRVRIHPTQKPIALIEKFFEELGSKHNSIVDLYGGSGSTLVACEKTDRKCFMMELDTHYVDVIVSRYVKFTGNNKIKRNGEEIEWQI